MDGTVRVRTVIGYSLTVFAGVVATVIMLWALHAHASGPGESDSTFVPIAPCRLADTRVDFHVGSVNSFGAGQTQTFLARGTNGQCTIPAEAVGLSMNVTAVGATAPTFVTIWGDGAQPLASSLNPIPGQPPTPNAVSTPLSSTGSFQVFNLAGSLDLVVDVNGYYTKGSLHSLDARVQALETAGLPQAVLDRLDALEAENTALETKVAALETKTASMSVRTDFQTDKPTVRFTGVNVQVVSGSGGTDGAINGTGNLIVGYNENSGDTKTGSHNLIVGKYHTYTSYGGLVAGYDNTISGVFASVSGGQSNTASGANASVSGGHNNTASGGGASVSGGQSNTASDFVSSVSGGSSNTASNNGASVSGGVSNAASGFGASVSGGNFSSASGSYASVSGGYANLASGSYASVSGGSGNTASGGTASSVSGGAGNTASGAYATVSGGLNRSAPNSADWAAGTFFSDD